MSEPNTTEVEPDAENVVLFPGITNLPIEPARVLSAALKRDDLSMVIIIGETEDGEMYFASSNPDGPEVNWLLDKAKLALLKCGGAFPRDPE